MTEEPNYDGKFDAIVVGAGPAGSAAALTMAEQDLDVIIIERGTTAGAKNVFGGVLYTPRIRELVDVKHAPFERYVAEKRFGILSDHDETAVSMRPGAWREEPHNDAFVVERGTFDEWFAQKAVDAGATLITETTVLDLVRNDRDVIVGVETDRPNGTLKAPVVVVAEGANSLVAEKADLKRTADREHVAVSAKEVLKFDRDTIEERFRLVDDAGAAYNYFGEGAVGDAFGGGFIYTNKRSVSVGVVYRIEDAVTTQPSPEDTLNAFKSHPAVAPLVRDGHTIEYSAHAIPEGETVPDLVHDGAVLVGDAAGLVFNNGIHLEGTNMAVESGYHAGRAIADALSSDRTDAGALSAYERALEDSYVVKNLRHYNWFHDAVGDEKEFLFKKLPRALGDAQAEYFAMDDEPKATHTKNAKKRLFEATDGRIGALKRAWKFRKAFK